MRQKKEGRSPGRSMSELGRRLTSPRRTGPEQSLKASSGSRASAADSESGSSCLPPLPHHVRLALHGRQHHPPPRPLTTTQPAPEDLAAEPQLISPSVSLALPGASLASSTAERTEAPYPRARLYYLDPLLVSPAFRHVGRSARFPLTWSEGGGGGALETSRERAWARYVIRRLAVGCWRPAPREGEGGREPGTPAAPRARRALLAPPFSSSLLLLRELEISGTRRKLRSGSENRRAGKSPRFSNPTEHLNHLGS